MNQSKASQRNSTRLQPSEEWGKTRLLMLLNCQWGVFYRDKKLTSRMSISHYSMWANHQNFTYNSYSEPELHSLHRPKHMHLWFWNKFQPDWTAGPSGQASAMGNRCSGHLGYARLYKLMHTVSCCWRTPLRTHFIAPESKIGEEG